MIPITLNPDNRWQAKILNITVNGVSRRVRIDFRYLSAAGKWFVSMEDADAGEVFCRYVPLIASYTDFNDILIPYACKQVGGIVCVPVVDAPATVDPEFDNISEFQVLWGDSFGGES